MNSSADINVSNYSLDELKKCARLFEEYKEKNGETPPINTGYSFIDILGNRALSWTGTKTNQKWVAQILEILNGAEKEFKENRAYTASFTVYHALYKTKKIYDQMIAAGINKGETMDCLMILFKHFNYPFQETGIEYEEQSDKIFHKVKDLILVPDDKEHAILSTSLQTRRSS